MSGGWSRWRAIPKPPGAGGDLAAADLDGDGRPELIAVVAGHYRVGFGLGADGAVERWTDWTAIPDRRPAADLGAAVADLDGDGRPELLVLSDGAHTIGWGLDETGRAAGGWGPWRSRPTCRMGPRSRPRSRPARAGRRRRRARPRRACRARPRAGAGHRRLARARLQLTDPRRPRGAPAHRRRPVLRGLGRRFERPRGAPLPDACVALPACALHGAAHADRPVLRRPVVPGGRAAARGRRHQPLRPVPRAARRARLRSRDTQVESRAADAARALVPDADHARRRARDLGVGPRRRRNARSRAGGVRDGRRAGGTSRRPACCRGTRTCS